MPAVAISTAVSTAITIATMTACTPAPVPPPAGRAIAVRLRVDTGAEAPQLAGELALPARADSLHPVPAVLLLGGSGPQDRDGARDDLAGYRPWRELTDTLVGRGIAVLRFDDRGTGGSTGRFAGSTTRDFARDALTAIAWLRGVRAVAGTRLALVGHSEGALVALLVAADARDVRALALLGAPARNGREIARWQRQALVARDQAAFPVRERAAVLARAEAAASAMATRDPWLREWFALDPREVASGVHAAVLLLYGERDRQIPIEQAGELAAALRRGGSTVRVERLPRTDHLLLADDDGDPSGYVRLADRHVRPEALSAIAHFLSEALSRR